MSDPLKPRHPPLSSASPLAEAMTGASTAEMSPVEWESALAFIRKLQRDLESGRLVLPESKQKPGKRDQQDPNDELKLRWLAQPAIFCDTYAVDVWGDPPVARIAFGEYSDKEHLPFYRTAVVLPISDAKALIKSLQRLIEEAEKPQ